MGMSKVLDAVDEDETCDRCFVINAVFILPPYEVVIVQPSRATKSCMKLDSLGALVSTTSEIIPAPFSDNFGS